MTIKYLDAKRIQGVAADKATLLGGDVIYNATSGGTSSSSLSNTSGGNWQYEQGMQVTSSENGKKLRTVKVFMGQGTSTDTTGTYDVRVYTGTTLKGTSNTKSPDDIADYGVTTTEQTFTFATPVTLATNDYVVVHASDGGAATKYANLRMTDDTSPNHPFRLGVDGSSWATTWANVINMKFESPTNIIENTIFEDTAAHTSYFLQDGNWKDAGLYWSRGVFGGGYSLTNIMEYLTLDTTGNVTDFGDLTVTRKILTGLSSQTRGCFGGGENGGNSNVIDYITIATTGDATDFGNLTRSVANSPAPASSETRGLWAGGFESSNSNTIDYITIASTGNATDFGDTTQARNTHAGLSDTSRACFAGGSSYTNIIDYVTIDTTGNALDFGDLTVARSGLAGVDHKTRGVIMGGYTGSYVDTIDYITIQTLGNATDFGNLTSTRAFGASCASNTRGLFGGGGGSGGYVNIIEYITIVTLGDATDFGDLSTTRGDLGAVQG